MMQDPMSIGTPPPEPSMVDKLMQKNAPVPPDAQKANLKKFNAPIPGQSLTSAPGSHPYEQPPQFTSLQDVAGYMFDKLTNPKIHRDLMRLLDAGVPVSYIIEPMILQGVNKGIFNLDLGMLAMKPVAVMIAGLATRAGVNVTWQPPDTDPGIDPEPIRKIFEQKKKAEAPMPAQEQRNMVQNSLLGKPANA